MRKLIFLFSFLILTSLVHAESTFFDNPNDAFIIGEASSSAVTTNSITESSCRYEWDCTNWSECFSSENQTRSCVNVGTCSDTYKTPELEQNCTYVPKVKKEEIESQNKTEGQLPKEPEEVKVNDKEKEDEFSVYFYIVFLVLILFWFIRKDIILKYSKKDKSKSAQKLKRRSKK